MAATPNEALVGNFASSTPSTLMGFAQTTGLPANIVLGTNLSMTGSTLNATGGGGGGSVTSVALSGGTTGITVSGSPITTSGTITLSGVLVAVNGGTGQSVYAVGDILQASSTTGLAKLAAVATGNVLISGGVSTISSWGKVGLTTHISGILPVANGGTNIASYTTGDLIYASSSSVLAKLPVGTNGQVLTLSGGLPTWQTGGGGGGSGTVTSVSMTVPSIFAIGGSPITTSGTLAVTLATQAVNTIFAGPASGGSAIPTFRAMALADLPFDVIEDVTGTTYSFSAADNKKIKRFTNVSGCTATVPTGLTTGWEVIAYRGSGAGTLTLASAGTLEAAGSTLNTEKTSAFIFHRGSNIHVALGAFSTGITNTAANNEVAKSDGTNLIPSGLFVTTNGNVTLGNATDATTIRTISVNSISSDVDLILDPKGNGLVGSTSNVYSTGLIGYRDSLGGVPNHQVLINDGQIFASKTTSTHTLTIYGSSGQSTSVNGDSVTISGGVAYSLTGNGNGGSVFIRSGERRTAGSGVDGNITIDSLNGFLIISTIPTSAAGLPSGGVWSNAGVLNIVP